MEVHLLVEPEPSVEAAPSFPARRMRFRLGTLLMLVAALAPVIALLTQLYQVFSNDDPDFPFILTLGLVLTGSAIGAWRRCSPLGTTIQIGLTGCVLLAILELQSERPLNYVWPVLFGLTVALPLWASRAAESLSDSWKRRTKAMCIIAGNVFLNTLAVGVFMLVNVSMGNLNGFVSSPVSVTTSNSAVAMPYTAPVIPVGTSPTPAGPVTFLPVQGPNGIIYQPTSPLPTGATVSTTESPSVPVHGVVIEPTTPPQPSLPTPANAPTQPPESPTAEGAKP